MEQGNKRENEYIPTFLLNPVLESDLLLFKYRSTSVDKSVAKENNAKL